MHSCRIDAFRNGSWYTLLEARNKDFLDGWHLQGMEGWDNTPTIVRNQATPLFGNGVVLSPVATYGELPITLEFLQIRPTMASVQNKMQALRNSGYEMLNIHFRIYKTYYEHIGGQYVAQWHETAVAAQTDSYLEQEQLGTTNKVTMNFIVPSGIILRTVGAPPIG